MEEEEEERTQSHIQCLSKLNYQYALVMLPSMQVAQLVHGHVMITCCHRYPTHLIVRHRHSAPDSTKCAKLSENVDYNTASDYWRHLHNKRGLAESKLPIGNIVGPAVMRHKTA